MLDVNVFVSAALSPNGVPASLIRAWYDGAFELVVSPRLLAELEVTLEYPKFKRKISPDDVVGILKLVTANAEMLLDSPVDPTITSRDPKDNYLIALADEADAVLVSGDKDLLSTEGGRVYSPRRFYEFIEARGLG